MLEDGQLLTITKQILISLVAVELWLVVVQKGQLELDKYGTFAVYWVEIAVLY